MPIRWKNIVVTVKRHWLALAVILLLAFPTAGFVLMSGGILAYTFWPIDASGVAMPSLAPDTSHVVVIAHGVGDTPASWAAPLQSLLEEQATAISTQIIALDWSEHARSSFRCSVNGKLVGEHIAEQLSQQARLTSVQVIGHSCGSFVVYGLCQALKQRRAEVLIHATYLDPVSIYGGLWWRYGLEHFGSCADFSEAYIDHEDSVPGSNELLPHTHTFDVTGARHAGAHSEAPHVWPTAYYQQLVSAGGQPQGHLQKDFWERFPRGVLEPVDNTPHRSEK